MSPSLGSCFALIKYTHTLITSCATTQQIGDSSWGLETGKHSNETHGNFLGAGKQASTCVPDIDHQTFGLNIVGTLLY